MKILDCNKKPLDKKQVFLYFSHTNYDQDQQYEESIFLILFTAFNLQSQYKFR